MDASVISMAQQLLRTRQAEGPYEREALASAIDDVAKLLDASGKFDRERAIAELEARTTVSIGRATRLVDETGHIPWYFGERQKPGPFFIRYEEYLQQYQGWNNASLGSLNDATDQIIELLEAPDRDGAWDRRGLVVGHVQSGKTANYAGLICKAADAGYRLIIVLAGMHNALRKQTQERLDRDFLGYDTKPTEEDRPNIGVGLINPNCHAGFLTNQAMNGDFSRPRAETQGAGVAERPLLLVVKKNASILKNLNRWVHDILDRRGDTRTIPLLVIDDEADQASVDTGDQDFDDGVPDPDYEPKQINRQIRMLIDAFEKSAYVGYTATPFANILIHEARRADRFGADLFPKSFIINLPAPTNYVGPAALFGIDGEAGDAEGDPLPLIRSVDQDGEGWIVAPHDKSFTPLTHGERRIPPSLEEAILAFIIVCAARRARGQTNVHNSMLVHVSRFTNVQRNVHAQVEEWFTEVRRQLRYRTGSEGLIERIRKLWEFDFEPTSEAVAATPSGRSLIPLTWNEVEAELSDAAERISPRLVNSEIRQPLDYDAHEADGLSVIAIGGDKLSRGLTLEGLSVSYFLRQSSTYDSLMQMGRWFGYRLGYVDLCRLYTTDDMTLWFRHVATAAEELREQLDHMAMLGASPVEYGLKIQSHDILLVTAQNKMRHSAEVQVSFAGEGKIQTVFDSRPAVILRNAEALGGLLDDLPSPTNSSDDGPAIWTDVDGIQIAKVLKSMAFPEESYDVNGARLAEYIEQQLAEQELVRWTVALRSGDGQSLHLGKRRINTVERSPLKDRQRPGRYVIKSILSPRDEAIDLDDEAFAAALEMTNAKRAARNQDPTTTPGGPEIRHVRGRGYPQAGVPAHPDRGLLLIYPLDPATAGIAVDVPIVGIVVSFPASTTARPVRYRFNSVKQRLELDPG